MKRSPSNEDEQDENTKMMSRRLAGNSPTANISKAEPTTSKEIWAWWLYMVAIEPISVAVLQLFMPFLLQALPGLVGHIAGSPSEPCTGAIDETCVLLQVGSLSVTGSTFTYTIITLSVLLQAFVFILFGALADYGSMRRHFLIGSTAIGSFFCLAILLVRGPMAALIAGILDVLITISFGVSLMLYNSYLPLLSENHPETTSFVSDDPREMSRQREKVSNGLSTKSFMLGYGSAILVLIASAGFMILVGDTKFIHLQLVIAFAGIYWGIGSIFPLLKLKNRPGPKLPEGSNRLTFSIKKTLTTVGKWRKLPHTFRFLMSYFLFADGYNTIGHVAVVFAIDVLNASYKTLITCAILTPCAGVAGTYIFFFIHKHFNISSKSMLIGILSLFLAMTVYGGSGVYFKAFGLHHMWELYVIAISYGFLIGAVQSFARVIFAEMIPPGEESEFFSLYAITDKGSSWIGPASQAIINLLMPDPRYGIFFLGLMILLPMPVLIWGVDPVQGQKDAIAFAEAQKSKVAANGGIEMGEKE